ncbi:MAG TPA: hypothetical protein DEA78_22805 [Cyanobacteria bacterium UBA11159]|nr:hypothetical protein [Cyanobacteria bacterium UBA11367]HBE58833.1 hypothetical protein [Cyanobacteria bacterium UBA11366]HBK63672.1 hypothetical protein [Cyanobacteria bacterium UBA11166]HBR76435.1 hypothetical protein [Cyanobacteria bacterium UBA11159]HBS68415.1 hypothetical protein [Cyanobacteria bacterium UBA11153]HCA94498.1 hypothetical protein [Cyanobacteria bacterium UBA9226]
MRNALISSLSIAAATATAVLNFGGNAQAAFLGIDPTPTPGTAIANKVGSVPFQANIFQGNGQTYQFSVLNPSGLGSRGMAKSEFGFLVNGNFTSLFGETQKANAGSGNANDWLGTCTPDSKGNVTINPCTINFNFAQGVNYQLALKNNNVVSSAFAVYQKDSYTFNTKSDEQKNMTTTTVAEAGAYFIGAEDGKYKAPGQGNYYSDYQDWVVKATAVPEPTTMAASFLGAGVIGMLKRRRKDAKN